MVNDFLEVFSANLPSIPLACDMEFCIDLEHVTRHISISPYIMAWAELRKLKF